MGWTSRSGFSTTHEELILTHNRLLCLYSPYGTYGTGDALPTLIQGGTPRWIKGHFCYLYLKAVIQALEEKEAGQNSHKKYNRAEELVR